MNDEFEQGRSAVDSQVDMGFLIRTLVKYNASDLHLKVGRPPLFRINGKLIAAKMPELTHVQAESIIYGVMTQKKISELETQRNVDFSFRLQGTGRFRCNVYYQRGSISAAIRMIPLVVPKIDDLGVPAVLKELCRRPRGLIIIAGATGGGKSTTLAAMLQYINENSHLHILSLEDPIEFLHRDLKASITQREVGTDVHSLSEGLRSGLRQDPDVLVLTELRDREMIQAAITAAETGHLVLSTLHTNDCRGTIDRIVDVFPAEAKNQVRIQLASTLIAVMAQQLVLRADGSGRVPACEVMVKSPAIEDFILKNDLDRIPELIESSNTYYKMQSMNQALEALVKSGVITAEEALKNTMNPGDLRLRLSGVTREQGYEMAGKMSRTGS